LDRALAGVGDSREKPQLPTKAVVIPAFVMQLCRLGSFNALEQTRGEAWWRKLMGHPLPSADTMGYVYERLDCQQLREALIRSTRGCGGTRPWGLWRGGWPRQWDIEGFTTWPQVGRPMRVVRSLETTTRRERVGKKWKTTEKTHDWVWTTTLPRDQASTQAIVELGHARWRIENQGFNDLCTFWHFDHVFRHHPNAILGLLLTLALAFNLFHAFWALNIKPQLRCRHTKIYWGYLLTASWWNLATSALLRPP